jgi:pimeloyl-ACP methyl ester carboxylesterase
MPMLSMRDDSKVFIRVLGRGQPVLLLHGFSLDSRQWLPLIAPYLHRYQFILPDCRGHGRSPTGSIDRAHVLETLMQDLEDILKSLGIERCILAAYSMGAVIGLHFALRWGAEKILRYMHVEASPCFANSEAWQFGFSPYLRDKATQLVQLWDQTHLDDESSRQAYQNLIHELARQAFPQVWLQQIFKAIPIRLVQPLLPDPLFTRELFSFLLEQGYDVRASMSQLEIPGLVVSGGQSAFFPWQGLETLHQAWRNSEFLLFAKSGHGLMYSEPLKFRRAFDTFLSGQLHEIHNKTSSHNWLGLKKAR